MDLLSPCTEGAVYLLVLVQQQQVEMVCVGWHYKHSFLQPLSPAGLQPHSVCMHMLPDQLWPWVR